MDGLGTAEGGTRILIVDDNPTNLRLLMEVLETRDYTVLAATNGPRALQVAGQVRPDLILLDVMMPEMDGYEVCRRLKASPETAGIPVIFITADDQAASVVAGFRTGAVDYIPKPFRQEEVLARVQAHLSLHRLTRELEEKNRTLEETNRQLQQANQQIQEASRHKSAFLARMSHDLRTPMNAIIGYTRILLRKAKDPLDERQYHNLENIQVSADHLLRLINDILDLSRVEAGRIDLKLEAVDLGRLIEECALSVESLLKPGVQLVQQLEEVAPVHTDPDRLRRVLMNLLSNAVKFTAQGSIAVSLRGVDGGAEFSVADTGVGIPAADLPHIFEEFRQVEREGCKPEGSGLGLAIAHKSVELLGGTIAVQSEVGRGTTFTVRITE